MQKSTFILLAATICLLAAGIPATGARNGKSPEPKNEVPAQSAQETPTAPATQPAATARPAAATAQGGARPYAEVVTKDAMTSQGFITVHQVRDRVLVEIPDSILGRDIMVVSRIVSTSADMSRSRAGWPGDEINSELVRFEKGQPGKIYMRDVFQREYALDEDNLGRALKNTSSLPIAAVLDIKANGEGSVVVDLTEMIKNDRSFFSFGDSFRKNANISSPMADASYLASVKAFSTNIEIRSVKTYSRGGSGGPMPAATTYELNSSILLLPKEPMKARLFDPRVGYMNEPYTEYDSNPYGSKQRYNIVRWRMEPKKGDEKRYAAGQLVEPRKPIVFYIDPATPRKWVPYLMAGVNDWKKAFEKAGFKNAIYALEAPTDDPTWSLEDAAHSAIVYKPSEVANARGANIHDPRTGEIIESHIDWHHSVMEMANSWYTVQCGPLDKRAQKPVIDDELMGRIIRYICAHEVGHALGLRHNYGASATIPVEKLRDKAWVEANGHTPSIMDYARFNYVAQPEDRISEDGLFPRIGIYDEWAIEWGYRWLPQFKTPEDEVHFSNESIIAKLKKDVRYTFGSEADSNDPRNQGECVGDNAMLASHYGILNLQRIVPNILSWTRQPDSDYSAAGSLYRDVVAQYTRYMGHVATYIGGVYSTPRTVEENAPTRVYVPADLQRQAVDFLSKELFATPEWLIDSKLIEYAGIDPMPTIASVQSRMLDRLLSRSTIDKIAKGAQYGGQGNYTPRELMDGIKNSAWGELSDGTAPDAYRRTLQRNYIRSLVAMLERSGGISAASASANPDGPALNQPSSPTQSDGPALARVQLGELYDGLKQAAQNADDLTRAHYESLRAAIGDAIKAE